MVRRNGGVKPKTSVYIATSLDGYIARTDGSLDWLDKANTTVTKGEDCGFKDFMDSIDVLVMGRKTFEKVLSFGTWGYGNTPVIVLSSNPLSFPDTIPESVTHSSESPRALLQRLSDEDVHHIYVDGGNTIQRFLAEGLIDEITVTTIPVILGSGISLFGSLDQDIHLNHLHTTTFEFGFVQTTYSVENNR
jgi:dihydrofolate reductase